MSPYIHRLGRYVRRLTDEYTTMYITGPILFSFNYLRQWRYQGIYTHYTPRY
jgi:hypothetical protein